MSQDNGSLADAPAAETASSFADAFEIDSDVAVNGEKQPTVDAQGFASLDEDGEDAGDEATAETPKGEEPKDEKAEDAESGNADGDGEDEGKDGDEPTEEKPGKKKPSGSQRLRAQVDALKAQLAALTQGKPLASAGDNAGLMAAVEQEIGAPPKQEDYANFLDFEHAKQAYETEKRVVAREMRNRAQHAANAAAIAEQNRKAELVEAHAERLDGLEKALPGSLTKVEEAIKSGKLQAAAHVNELVLDSDKSGLLALHFAENPDALAALNRLHPVHVAKEIGKLEARLSLPKPKTTTKAPPPPKAVPKGSAAPSTQSTELESWLKRKYG